MNFGNGTHDASFDLPDVKPGVTLLEADADLGVTPLQTLILDQVITGGGEVWWVDGGGRSAVTTRLRELVPNLRYMDRIQIARAFNPHQHTSLIDRVGGAVQADEGEPVAFVATDLDLLFRDSDVDLETGREMLVRSIAKVARLGRKYNVPVLVTRVRDNEFSEPIANAATTRLECESTPFGPRYTDDEDEIETLVYPAERGYVQTTLAFWQEVLEHRVRINETATSSAVTTGASWN